jgi:hypothetical protein
MSTNLSSFFCFCVHRALSNRELEEMARGTSSLPLAGVPIDPPGMPPGRQGFITGAGCSHGRASSPSVARPWLYRTLEQLPGFEFRLNACCKRLLYR